MDDLKKIKRGESMKNEFLKELQWRGLINDCTDLEALDALMEEGILHYIVGLIQQQTVYTLVHCFQS